MNIWGRIFFGGADEKCMRKIYFFFEKKKTEQEKQENTGPNTLRDSSNESQKEKSSSWLNCALQDDELYKVIQVGTCWYWVSIGRY